MEASPPPRRRSLAVGSGRGSARRKVQYSSNASEASSRSTSRSRFEGSRSARNARTSSAPGSRPVRSIRARRRKVASSDIGEGGMRSVPRVARTASSMRLRRGSPVRVHRLLGHRDDQLHGDDPVEIAGDHHVSTGPVDHGQAGFVRASQLDGRGLGRREHRPARSRPRPTRRRTAPGPGSRPRSRRARRPSARDRSRGRGAVEPRGGAPPHGSRSGAARRLRRSPENRTPPSWSIRPVALARIRLSAGRARLTRRPSSSWTIAS